MTINDWLEESPNTRCAIHLQAIVEGIRFEDSVFRKRIRRELPCSEAEILTPYFRFIMPIDFIEERLDPAAKGICRFIDTGFFEKFFYFALEQGLAFSWVCSAFTSAMFAAGWIVTEEKYIEGYGNYLCFEYSGFLF